MEEFTTFLASKKIDAQLFKEKEPQVFENWLFQFEQMHPKSFVLQQLFVINAIRRKYPYQEPEKPIEVKKVEVLSPIEEEPKVVKPKTAIKRPVIVRKKPNNEN